MRGRQWSFVAGLVLASGCGAPPAPAPAPAPPPPPSPPPPAPPAPAASIAETPPPPPDPCDAVPEGMACIPGGPFVRGVDEDDHRCPQGGNQPTSAATPAMTIEVDAFYLDLTEVTVAAWARCHEGGACEKARPFYPDFDAPAQPKVGVSWFDAKAYCTWAGKRLPTEAEWEKAARGPGGEATPFGDIPITCDHAVIMDRTGRSCGTRNRAHKPSTGRVLPVRSRPAGRYGLFDMVGNAEEWVADWWTPSWEACGEACEGPNPKGPCDGAEDCPGHRWRSVRGGSWYWPADHATGYHRRRHFPPNRFPDYHHFGFRCAMDAQATAG